MEIVVLTLIIILVIVCTMIYNKIVTYKNKVKESLALINIHLKLRFDLIPNLVKVVKEYSKQENEVFSKLIKIRKLAIEAIEEKEKLKYANMLVPNIRHLLIIAEDYPKLKKDALYKSLMEELILVEDKIAASRKFYDSNINEYNTLISIFPNNIIAAIFKFGELELLKIDVGENFSSKINVETNKM